MTTGVTGTTNTVTTAADYMKKTTGLNKDDFMKLFITQLENQDPLQPQDSSAFVAQMAQMTQVEQAYNTNTNLQNLLNAVNSSSSQSAVSYIGKAVLAQGNQVNLAAGVSSQLGYNFDSAASNVQIGIQNSEGVTVRNLTLGAVNAGEGSVKWDGLDGNGRALPPGVYNFTVAGKMADGSAATAQPLVAMVVDGINMVQGQPVLTSGGIEVPMANILSIRGAM